jgi:hypothetical protein
MARCELKPFQTAFNWSVPVRSLLAKFQHEGFTITAVNDGEETIKIDQEQSNTKIRRSATDIVVSVDAATVYINKDGMRARLWIVLGNEPEEIVCDYTYHPKLETLIVEVIDNYSMAWEGVKCPMITD